LLSRELTDASKVEKEIKEILSERKKSLTSQSASSKGQNNPLITLYDTDNSDISRVNFGVELADAFCHFPNYPSF